MIGVILSDGGIKAYLSRGLLKIEPLNEDQIRENGIDLTIGSEYAILAKFPISEEDYKTRDFSGNEIYIETQYIDLSDRRLKRRVKRVDVESGKKEEKEEDVGELSPIKFSINSKGVVLYPGVYLLHTSEYIEMPPDLVGLVHIKSSLARLGLYVPPTVVDAGFKGQLVIEVIVSSFPVKVRPGVPFIHLIFARTDSPVIKDYSVRGRYQGQRGIVI